MSSPIEIPIRPCLWVGVLAALPWSGLVVFVLALAHSYGPYFLILSPAALAGAIYQWRLNGRLGLDRSITGLTVTDEALKVQLRSGDGYTVAADSASRVYPRLLVLKLTPLDPTHRSSTVLLWADNNGTGNVPGDLHRQLRAWLRLGFASDTSRPTN